MEEDCNLIITSGSIYIPSKSKNNVVNFVRIFQKHDLRLLALIIFHTSKSKIGVRWTIYTLRFVVDDKSQNIHANNAIIRQIASKSVQQIVACKRTFTLAHRQDFTYGIHVNELCDCLKTWSVTAYRPIFEN